MERRSASLTARRLDASSLSLLCMTVGNFCCDGRAIPNSSFRAKRRIQNYSSDQRTRDLPTATPCVHAFMLT
ncbi:MAG: hypothetical protein IJW31_00260 [Lentisphaeria bacterium]|nr:hypothetical protein [Lentisphaeria bacterium]